jgi:hypothetical protein
MPALPAGVALRELLLEPAAVEQDDLHELRRRARQVDRAIEPVAHHDGEQPAMVEMGVGHEDCVDVLRLDPERDPVPDHLVGAALEHSAVDEDPGPGRRQEEARPGDGGRTAEKGDLHAVESRSG